MLQALASACHARILHILQSSAPLLSMPVHHDCCRTGGRDKAGRAKEMGRCVPVEFQSMSACNLEGLNDPARDIGMLGRARSWDCGSGTVAKQVSTT